MKPKRIRWHDPAAVWVLVHRRGCAQPAYYVEEVPIAGALRVVARPVLLDGSHPDPNDAQVCGTCGVALKPRDLSYKNLQRLVREKH